MRSWPPFQLIVLSLILAGGGIRLHQLLQPDPTTTPATRIEDSNTSDDPTPDREIYLEWEATAAPDRLVIFTDTGAPVVSLPAPGASGDAAITTTATTQGLRLEVDWPETTIHPVAMRVLLEPDHLPSRSVILWLESGTRQSAAINL